MARDLQDFIEEVNSDTVEFAQRVVQAANQRNRDIVPREAPRIEVESNTLYSREPRAKITPTDPTIPLDSCRKWYSNPVTYT